jgi:hypothetical protein
MKVRMGVLSGLVAFVVGAGCAVPGDGTVESCTGSFTGTFEGGESGPLSSSLFITGKLVSTFLVGGMERKVTNMVSTAGAIEMSSGELMMTGTMNLEDCTASGEWSMGSAMGTWAFEKM